MKNIGSNSTTVNGPSSFRRLSARRAARHDGAEQETAEHRMQADGVGDKRGQHEEHQHDREQASALIG